MRKRRNLNGLGTKRMNKIGYLVMLLILAIPTLGYEENFTYNWTELPASRLGDIDVTSDNNTIIYINYSTPMLSGTKLLNYTNLSTLTTSKNLIYNLTLPFTVNPGNYTHYVYLNKYNVTVGAYNETINVTVNCTGNQTGNCSELQNVTRLRYTNETFVVQSNITINYEVIDDYIEGENETTFITITKTEFERHIPHITLPYNERFEKVIKANKESTINVSCTQHLKCPKNITTDTYGLAYLHFNMSFDKNSKYGQYTERVNLTLGNVTQFFDYSVYITIVNLPEEFLKNVSMNNLTREEAYELARKIGYYFLDIGEQIEQGERDIREIVKNKTIVQEKKEPVLILDDKIYDDMIAFLQAKEEFAGAREDYNRIIQTISENLKKKDELLDTNNQQIVTKNKRISDLEIDLSQTKAEFSAKSKRWRITYWLVAIIIVGYIPFYFVNRKAKRYYLDKGLLHQFWEHNYFKKGGKND